MVDIGAKPVTRRVAVAEGRILMEGETLRLIEAGGHSKGDVLCIARIAGIMGAKKTADLVPLCHPLNLTHVEVDLVPIPNEGAVHCRCAGRDRGQDRRRNGGARGGPDRPPHDLRHVQIGRSGNDDHRCAAHGEVRREIGYLAARGVS